MKRPSKNQQIATALGISLPQVRRTFNGKPEPLSDIEKISTIKEVSRKYADAFPGSERQTVLLHKWIALCSNTRELNTVWSAARQKLVGETKVLFIGGWLHSARGLGELRTLISCFSSFTITELRPIVQLAYYFVEQAKKSEAKK